MTALTVNALTFCTSKQKKMTSADKDMKDQPRAIAGSPKTSEEAVKLRGSRMRTHGDSASKISSGSLDKTSAQMKVDLKPASKDEKIQEDSFDKIQPRVAMAKRAQEIANLHVEGRRKDYETLEGMMTDDFA